MNNIFDTIEKNKFNYEDIKLKSYIHVKNAGQLYDLNVIIGFRGRQEFLSPLIDSITKAFEYYNIKYGDKKFCLTFVEHSENPDSKIILEQEYNYIWTPGNVTSSYSRSFAYNFGVKYSNMAKYYLLHDLDILIKENFFEELYQNLKDSRCMQTYGKRRVLYLSQDLTPKVINKEFDFNRFNENSVGVSLPMYAGQPALGSKGGSIVIERDLYYEIGGFDPEVFWGYAAEDQMFWDKAMTILGEVNYADNPPIDIFHMWHPPTSMTNPLVYEMENYMLQFRNMKKKDRIRLLEVQKNNFKDGE
jgi:hypothetical protein